MTTNLDLQVETLREVRDLALSSADATKKLAIIPIPSHPEGNYYTVNTDGAIIEHSLPLPARRTTLSSVDQPGLFARHAMQAWDCTPAIYYDHQFIHVRLEDSNLQAYRGQANCSLMRTEVWKRLNEWSDDPGKAWMSHSVFIRELRVTFGECFSSDALDRLIETIGQLDFVTAERTQSVATRNRESMGREVMSEVKAAQGQIPEQVVLDCRIYRDPILLRKHSIRCLLETDPAKGRLAVIPLAGELDNAMDAEMHSLGELLRASVRAPRMIAEEASGATQSPTSPACDWQIPVFYGQF